MILVCMITHGYAGDPYYFKFWPVFGFNSKNLCTIEPASARAATMSFENDGVGGWSTTY